MKKLRKFLLTLTLVLLSFFAMACSAHPEKKLGFPVAITYAAGEGIKVSKFPTVHTASSTIAPSTSAAAPLKTTKKIEAPPPTTIQLPATRECLAIYDVNIRSGPGEGYSVITTIGSQTLVTVTGEAEEGWLPVQYGGLAGYIRQDLLQAATDTVPQQPAPAIDIPQNAHVLTPEVPVEAGVVAAPVVDYVAETVPEIIYTTVTSVEPPILPPVEQTYTVYITDTGTKYHLDGCHHLRKSQHAITIDEAISRGYTPCKHCYGP